MPMYTFHFCNLQGVSSAFEAREADHDAAAFAMAGDLLEEHQSCDHVDVRESDRPVIARYREQPIIRAVYEPGQSAST